MYLLLIILIVIAALLMCFIVLIQNSKGGGLASGFSSSNQIMGVRKTTDFLEKATWYLAGTMVVLCIAASFFLPRNLTRQDSNIREHIQNTAPVTDPNAVAPFETPVPDETPVTPAPETPAE